MKSFTRIICATLLLLAMPLRQFAQPVQTVHGQPTIEFNITDIANFDERVFTLYNLANDSRFDVITSERDGIFIVSANEAFEGLNLEEAYNEFRTQNAAAFSMMDKEQAAEAAAALKAALPNDFTMSLMMDIYARSRDNNLCVLADPFCTDNGMYEFPAGVNAGSGESGPYYSCLYTQPNPAWYYMRIGSPAGSIDIYMYSTPSHDIDFCCWGPYSVDPTIPETTPCPNGLTSDKVVSCSYSAAATEHCMIPATSQTGEYYILVITNYSNQACNINFSKVGGTGVTDCGILPPLVDNGGPYCVGETISLTANGQSGASYSWTGPAGFSSNQQNPTRPNCTMNMAGTYTCTIAVGSQTNSATTEVVIYPQPTADFTYTAACAGNAVQFNSTSTTNPTGQPIQSYQWNFGDGQTGTGQTVSHTYAQAGSYQVTLTVQATNNMCSDVTTRTVPVNALPTPTVSANPSTVIYGGTTTLTATAGTQGTFNFRWEPANKVVNPNSQTTQTVPLYENVQFTCTVTNPQGGCSGSGRVTVVIEGSNMMATASADNSELCEGESTMLHAEPSGGTGNYTFAWTPANTLNNANIQDPVATPPLGLTTYTCHVSDGLSAQDVSVSVYVYPHVESDINVSICPDDTYNFFGEILSEEGDYDHIVVSQHGCDSTIHLHLTHHETYETSISDHFCQGDTYSFFGEPITSSGVYYHTLETVNGCDSIIRLNLIQDPSYEVYLTESTCEGGPGYYFAPLDTYFQPSPIPNELVFQTQAGCDSIVYLTVEEAEYNSKTYVVSLCATEYTWPSNGHTYYETGIYFDTLQYANSCDSTLILNLELRPSFDDEVVVTSCDAYRWKNDTYNVDMTFTESTVYTHHYINAYGCDSEATLHLTINDHDEYTFTVSDEENCNEYFWDPQGHEIISTDHEGLVYDMSGVYHRTYKNNSDCDSIVTMNVQFEYTPNPTPIYPMDYTTSHWVVTATEFQINTYDFNLWDQNPNCHWDSISWSFDNPNLDWVLEPFGTNGACCRLYVLSWVNDTVWLNARAFNRCSPSDGIERKYWLISSFIGVEEHQAEPKDFDVIPNPNNGQMTLNFDQLSGKIDIRVYDMRGTLVDKFQTYNNAGPGTYQYDMRSQSDGIYFFIATSKEGTVAKKVVVQH